MTQAVIPTSVQCVEYDLVHKCLTLSEVSWILHSLERHSIYYTQFLLRATCGFRGAELIELSLHNISPDFKTITYRVKKPRKKQMSFDRSCKITKERRVVLDEWVASELRAYCDKWLGTDTLSDGRKVYVSPHEGKRLFGQKNVHVLRAYWCKLLKKMKIAGFETSRASKEFFTEKGIYCETKVMRLHMFRHFSASVMYYRFGKDMKRVQEWIKHEEVKTTEKYIHSAGCLGSDEETLSGLTWCELFGFVKGQKVLSDTYAPSQTSLGMY